MKQRSLKNEDPLINELIIKERFRQNNCISLIASENFVSLAIMEAVGSVLTNKYAEGYPGRRYYGGCQYYDEIENLAISRAQKLFQADHANVQPHSGSNANLAVYLAAASLGDPILAMSLDHGGHLTHGSKVNFSGKLFEIIPYGVQRETGLIDYDAVQDLAERHRPKVIIAGASAYTRIIDFARFAFIAQQVSAKLFVDMAHIAGLVAAGLHPSPIPHADFVTATTHKTLRGPRGGLILCKSEYKKAVDSWVFPGVQGGPLMQEIAGKAVCFQEALEADFYTYQKQVIENAQVMAKSLAEQGFDLVAGGTDNHMVLIDLRSKGITGKEAESRLEETGIVVNKNKIPFDEQPPTITSGIRVGTPGITTRGMGVKETQLIAMLIGDGILGKVSKTAIREKVSKLVAQFPVY